MARETVALVGVNGAGKSTLLTCLSGGRRPTEGRVEIAGVDIYSGGRNPVLRSVALMPQQLLFPPNLTALESVALVSWMRGRAPGAARDASARALERVNLGDRADSKAQELSGGMLRRLALAQAIVNEPEVLLLDEPTTGLDPQQRRAMVELIQDVPGSVLLSSHVMEDVADLADRVLVLHEGRILYDGGLAELADRAPAGTADGRRAEAGFLSVISASR